MNWTRKKYQNLNFDENDYFNNHKNKFKIISEILSQEKPVKILDVGAGVGSVYSLLSSLNGMDIHAIEIVDEFIVTLKERGIHTYKFDLDKENIFPFANDIFDIVLCDSILEHTLKPLQLFTESKRVLKPNGKLILVVPNATSAKRRWGFLRGRNVFYPLIYNLFNNEYLQRCSIFYTREDLLKFTKYIFSIQNIAFIDEKYYDERSISIKVCRILSRYIPKLRDVLIMTSIKK